MSRLIDINAVIRMLNTMDRYTSTELTLCDTDKTFPKNEVFVVDDVYEGLDELPSAEPERRKGEWIHKKNIYGVVYCSECDYELHTNDTNFCPNCGADMRGE